MAHKAVAFLLVAVALAVAHASHPTSCPVTCDACSSEAAVVEALPRVTPALHVATSRLDYYDVFVCNEAHGTCDLASIPTKDFIPSSAPSNPRSVAVYVQSLGTYALVAVILALVTVIAALVCVCTRCSCCLCARLGGCGGVKPTPKADPSDGRCARLCGCGLGTELSPGGYREYPRKSKWLAIAFLLVFSVVTAGLVAAGQLRGVSGLKHGLTSVSTSPESIIDTLRGAQQPIGDSLVSFTDVVLRRTLVDVNTTVQAAVDLPAVRRNTACVLSHLDALPDTAVLLRFINDVNASVAAFTAQRPLIDSSLASLNATAWQLPSALTTVADELTTVNASLGALTGDFSALLQPLADTQALAAALNGSSSGVGSVSARLQVLQNPDSFPSPATAANVTTNPELNSTIAALVDGTLDGVADSPARDELAAKLLSFRDDVLALPNATTTAADVAGLAAQIDTAADAGIVAALTDSLSAANATVATLWPSMRALNASLVTVQRLLTAVDLNGAAAAIDAVNTSLSTFPATDVVVQQLQLVLGVTDALPCLSVLVDELHAVNTSLFRLPASADSAQQLLHDVNTTIVDKLPIITDFNTTLQDVEAALTSEAAHSLTDFSHRIDDFAAQIQSASATLGDVTADVDVALADVADLDLTTVIADTSSLNSSLHDPGLGDVTVDSQDLQALGTAATTLTTLISDAVLAIEKFSQGRCDAGGSVSPGALCDDSSQCGGAECLHAVRRCATDFGVACPTGTNTPCPAGTACLFVTEQFTNLSIAINAFASDHPALNATHLLSALNDIDAAVADLPDLDHTQADVTSVVGALQDIDVAQALSDVASSGADVQGLNVQDLDGSLDDVWSSIDDLPDFDSLRDDVVALQEPIDDADEYADDLQDADVTVAGLVWFLNDALPNITTRLSDAVLRPVHVRGGLPALVRYVAAVLDAGIQDVNNITAGSRDPFVLDINVTHAVEPAFHVLDTLHAPASTGPWYFLADLLEIPTVHPDAAGADGRIFTDGSGADYPHGHLCVTDTCVHNTIKWATTESVSTITDGTVPLDLNAELVVGLPYILPLLLVLLAVLAVVISACHGKLAQHVACTMASCTMVLLPLFFVVAGVGFFPTVLVSGDVCANAGNLAFSYVARSPATVCPTSEWAIIGSGEPRYESWCLVDVDGEQVTVAPGRLLQGLLGDCSNGAGADGEPYVAELFDSFSGPTSRVPLRSVNSALDSLGDGELSPRPLLADDLRAGGTRAGDVVRNAFTSLRDTLTCADLNAGLAAMQSAVCCDFFGAVYWALASWYLVTFAMCLCGCPAGVFAVKRLKRRTPSDNARTYSVLPSSSYGSVAPPELERTPSMRHPYANQPAASSPRPSRSGNEHAPLLT